MTLRRGSSPFRQDEVLTEGWEPNEIVGRDTELKQIEEVLQQIIDAEAPINSLLYGFSGTGKTACMEYKLNELESSAENYGDLNVKTVYQNCDGLNSSYQVAVALANQMLPESEQLPKSGLAQDDVFERLFDQIDELGTQSNDVTDYVVIVLDEIDNVGSKDRIIYQLPRARDMGRVEQVRLCAIGISNEIAYKEKLNADSESSFRQKDITFKKYNARQLEKILWQRTEKAFKPDAIDESAVKRASAVAAKLGGDARYALDLLHKAGIKAKTTGDDVVSDTHVEVAQEEKERDRISEVIDDLSKHEKLTLAALVYEELEGNAPIKRNDLYPRYKEFASSLLREVNVNRRIADYLKDMAHLSLINRTDAFKGPGESGFKYELNKASYEVVLRSLMDTTVDNEDGTTLLPASLSDAYDNLSP